MPEVTIDTDAVAASIPPRKEKKKVNGAAASAGGALALADFVAYMPMHNYIFVPNREIWPAGSVDARVPWPTDDTGKAIRPSTWLDRNLPVEQMTWAPGELLMIKDRLIAGGGWIRRAGCTTFNLYIPPTVASGNAAEVGPWLAHVRRLYGQEADHIVRWLAHRVQRPGEKVNHAIVLGGGQGIGKDSLLEPVKVAVGPQNFAEVSPVQILGRFNGFIKSVILRVSEARDSGDADRYALYEHMKVLTAAPPDVLRCDEKHLREHAVINCVGVIITTNYRDAIHLPPDDRRHFVAWSELAKEDFTTDYFAGLHRWYSAGGNAHVAAYLRGLDLAGFDPKAPPPKTDAWHEIVNASRAPEDAELADLLDELGRPAALTLADLINRTGDMTPIGIYLRERKNRRAIPHRLEAAGYVPVRNSDDRHDGQWRIAGKRQTIYARQELQLRDRVAAARSLTRR